MKILFWLQCGRIVPRSVWLDERKGRSLRTSYFLETRTAGCPWFSNLASPSHKKTRHPSPKMNTLSIPPYLSFPNLSFKFSFTSSKIPFFPVFPLPSALSRLIPCIASSNQRRAAFCSSFKCSGTCTTKVT